VCLVDSEAQIVSTGGTDHPRSQSCVVYPQGEQTEYDPEALRIDDRLGGPVLGFPVSGLGTKRWARPGLQLRADGRLSAIVNGEVVGT